MAAVQCAWVPRGGPQQGQGLTPLGKPTQQSSWWVLCGLVDRFLLQSGRVGCGGLLRVVLYRVVSVQREGGLPFCRAVGCQLLSSSALIGMNVWLSSQPIIQQTNRPISALHAPVVQLRFWHAMGCGTAWTTSRYVWPWPFFMFQHAETSWPSQSAMERPPAPALHTDGQNNVKERNGVGCCAPPLHVQLPGPQEQLPSDPQRQHWFQERPMYPNI